MTTPTSPKNEGRLYVEHDGSLEVELYWSERRTESVGFALIRRYPGGDIVVLIDDPRGDQVLRVREGEGCSYQWRVPPGAYVFPSGDLELWVKTPEDPRKIFSVYVAESST